MNDPVGPSPTLHVRLLGGFGVRAGEHAIPATAWRPRAAALVKLLALGPETHASREELCEWLWPTLSEGAARNNLHRTLHVVRQILRPHAPGCLRLEEGTLTLADPVRVDSAAFAVQAQAALASNEAEAYEAALALYRGELLPQDRYEDWAVGPREVLHGLYLQVATDYAELCTLEGRCRRAQEVLREVVRQEPALETAHLALMQLYLRSGQPHSAVMQYEVLRRALRRELGESPGGEAARLYHEVLGKRPSEGPQRSP